MAFRKELWVVHPPIIPFLTPMDLCDARLEEESDEMGLLIMTALVNHNKLNHSKAIQIVQTILGNAYQDKHEPTIANQDFGNDACTILGCNDRLVPQPSRNKVNMKDLHPNNDKQQQTVYRGLFPDKTKSFTQLLNSAEFQQLLKIDAMASDGQQLVAEYFAVEDLWASKKNTNTVQAYYKLLCLVKTLSAKDIV
jgi:hypothetical protein